MRLKTNVLFASSVIQNLKYYRGGQQELQEIEALLEDRPLYGFEYYQDIPSIRYFNKLFVGSSSVLGYIYLYQPTADLIAQAEQDEILVFKMSGPIWRPVGGLYLSPYERSEILRVIVEMYHTTKDTA